MKITLLSNDINLQKKINETGYFEEVSIAKSLTDINDIDVLLVSDEMVSLNEFLYSYENNLKSSIKTVYYMLSSIYECNLDNIYTMLKVKGIKAIPPKLTVNQIVEKLIQEYVPGYNKHKNIVTFFGIDSKVGTTQCAQGIAEILSRNTDLKICLMFLNGNPNTTYIKTKDAAGIDYIKAKILNNILTSTDLSDSCIVQGNLYILPGIESILSCREYHPENIEYLVDIASQEFGAVIIDAGSEIDSAMAITALRCTNNKFLVTTQQKSAKEKFDRINNQIFKLLKIEPSSFFLVLNKYIQSNSMYTPSQVADLYGSMLAGHVPFMELMGWQAEEEGRSLLSIEDKEYSQRLTKICQIAATQLNITMRFKKDDRQGLFKFLGKPVAGGTTNAKF